MEPEIIINGTKLTEAQAMTVRVAIESFMSDLCNDGLGEDDVRKAIANGYKLRIREIREVMYK